MFGTSGKARPATARAARARRAAAGLALCSILLGRPALGAAPEVERVLTSGMERNTLLELYTSEGCSSCPPADAWLAGLVDSGALWSQVVPVALHVTYWDDLGWPDALASADHDRRQRRLARAGRTGVYTPGMFRDGEEYRTWRRRRPDAPAADDAAVGELELRLAARQVSAGFAPLARRPADGERLRVHVAWLRGASTRVRAGENRGRRLRHEFAVARLDQLELVAADGRFFGEAPIERPGVDDSPAVAAWVEDDAGRVLQATGGWLAPGDALPAP